MRDDEDVLVVHDGCLEAQQEVVGSYRHVAVGVPPGRPQIRRFQPGDTWVPRRDVLRCVIEDLTDGETVVQINAQELTWTEFGPVLLAWEGWELWSVCVPEDELAKPPLIVVRNRKIDVITIRVGEAAVRTRVVTTSQPTGRCPIVDAGRRMVPPRGERL